MPRAGLRPSIVIAEAASLADDTGYEHLTLAALATRLNVAVPSLYKHVDGLDAIRRGIAILGLRELGAAMAEGLSRAAGRDGSAHVRALADAYRAYAGAHPGRYAATLRAAPPGDPEHTAAAEDVLQTVLAVLAERGLAGDGAVDATRALRAALHGFVTLEAAGGFGMPHDVGRCVRAHGPGAGSGLRRASPAVGCRPGAARTRRRRIPRGAANPDLRADAARDAPPDGRRVAALLRRARDPEAAPRRALRPTTATRPGPSRSPRRRRGPRRRPR